MEFAGKSAIVTGASRGIGLAVARLFAERGAALVIVARDPESLDRARRELEAFGTRVVAVAGDVGLAATAERVVETAGRELGGIDILANIAGAFPTANVENTGDAQYAEAIAANLTSTFVMCRAVLPHLRARGRGAIVNMSSTAARLPTPGLAVYGATKAGIEAFSRAFAVEVAPEIRVNTVSAGPTMTETVRALMEVDETDAVETVTRALPLRRLADPSEIAEAVLFLASDRASFVTGQVLHANGGGIMA